MDRAELSSQCQCRVALSAADGTRGSDMAEVLNDQLLRACVSGSMNAVLSLIERGADINSADGERYTPLHCACLRGHTDVALLLLDRGADIHSITGNGGTPLHSACHKGHTDIALALVRAGANTLAKNENDKTPLYYAKSEEIKAALIREREKYLVWTRRKAFMMFLVGYRYIAMRHHQPQAAAAADHGEEEPLVDRVMRMRELNTTIASFL